MIPFIAKLLAGPLIGKLLEAFKGWQAAKLSHDEMAKELEALLARELTAQAALQRDVLVAELQGESWLQRNWRPVVALMSFFSCWFVIFPYGFLVKWGVLPQVFFGEEGLKYFFSLTTVCVGGYIAGRSVEKIFRR